MKKKSVARAKLHWNIANTLASAQQSVKLGTMLKNKAGRFTTFISDSA